ncbi:histidinol-phosphatase [Coralliovum pocilloporae]|uniref:histidinol-phosphatase n=1 Tax=Coralliovum pocilloporae TaxID=3066369 RepID=UPI0033070008
MAADPVSQDSFALFHQLADTAWDAIRPSFRQVLAIDNKDSGGFDPVTEADRAAEQAMRALIQDIHPDHGIIGEEFGRSNTDAATQWVLDPIDGTRAFISGVPVWGTLIGRYENGRAASGMMSQGFTGERFFGDRSSAWYKGPDGARQLSTRSCSSLDQAALFCTSTDMFTPAEKATFEAVAQQARMTRFGTDCYAYAMLASGHVDLVIEADLKAYDIAALIPIIEGAGGIVTTWTGDAPENGGRIVAAGDPALHAAVLPLLTLAED